MHDNLNRFDLNWRDIHIDVSLRFFMHNGLPISMYVHDFELHVGWFDEPFDLDNLHQVNTVEKNADSAITQFRVWTPPSIPIL
jgi:hypothetical protein